MSADCIILIVDDDPIGRSSLRSVLVADGYRLESAPDGPTALALAAEIVPDLILLDVMMPGMDGYEVTRRIRAMPALAELPVLLVTALDLPEHRLAGLEAGADDFITKPVDLIELRARVRAITRLNRFRRLSQERERYRLLFENAPCGLLVIDERMDVRETNPLAQQLLDRVLRPGARNNLHQVVPPSAGDQLTRLLGAAEAGPPAARLEVITRAKDGSNLWLELSVTPLRHMGARAYQVAVRDLTAERVAEVNLRHAQKLDSVGQLAGSIAHDFNNLLTAINGFSEMALLSLPSDSPARELVEEVYQAGERATVLTRQLLAFARKQSPPPVPLDLCVVVANLEKMLRRLIGPEIEMTCRCASAPGRIRADVGQLEQILVNLVINARDAMPSGGTLTIDVGEVEASSGSAPSPAPRLVRLTVSDTGVGMTKEVRERIFEPFFTTKEPGKGTGLGLATVYSIVRGHGGHIDVTSEPGQGATVVIDFPRLEEPAEGDASARSSAALLGGNETILLAEDDDGVRSFARTALEAVGYTILAARDGMEAIRLERHHEGPIHLLVTDVVMPRLSGRHLLDSFRRSRPQARVIIASATADDEHLRRSGQIASDGLLTKPYSHTRLLQQVRTALDA